MVPYGCWYINTLTCPTSVSGSYPQWYNIPNNGYWSYHYGLVLIMINGYPLSTHISLDWFKGKFTGNHGFLPSNIGVSCKFSHHPILWISPMTYQPIISRRSSRPSSARSCGCSAAPAWSRSPEPQTASVLRRCRGGLKQKTWEIPREP